MRGTWGRPAATGGSRSPTFVRDDRRGKFGTTRGDDSRVVVGDAGPAGFPASRCVIPSLTRDLGHARDLGPDRGHGRIEIPHVRSG
jgi:hypothetical protein